MKTLLIILTIVALVGGGTAIYIAKSPKPLTTEVSVMRDLTSKQAAQPVASDIIPFYGLKDDEWRGANFHFTDLSDVSLNEANTATLDAKIMAISNEPERINAINTFEDTVSSILTNAIADTVGRSHSALYRPIANELNRLAQSTANKKTLIIYSDLMENVKGCSFYSQDKLNTLKNNPGQIRDYFSNEVMLSDLHGIEVRLIFQPQTTLEDREYQIVSKFYQNLLESDGAKVSISANITN